DYPHNSNSYQKAFQEADGLVFERFGIAVINKDHEDQINRLASSAKSRKTSLYSEPERFVYALHPERLTLWQSICARFFPKRSSGPSPVDKIPYEDDNLAYWGIHAVQALSANYSGKGVKIAVLDTGLTCPIRIFKKGISSPNPLLAGRQWMT